MTRLILGLSSLLLLQSNTIGNYSFFKEYYSNENGYFLNYKNKEELTALEIAIEGSETGNAIKFVTDWLNDDDYQNKFPFKGDEELIGETYKEKAINNFYLGYFLYKKAFNYPFTKFDVETDSAIDRIRGFLDKFMPQKDNILSILDDFKSGSYETCIGSIKSFEETFNNDIKEIWFEDVDYVDYYEDLRSILKSQSNDVKNGKDYSFDNYSNINDALSALSKFYKIDLKEKENFDYFIDDLSLNDDVRKFESDVFLDYIPNLDETSFGIALDNIRNINFSSEIEESDWNAFSNEQKLQFSKTYFYNLEMDSRTGFWNPIFNELDENLQKEIGFKNSTYFFSIFNLSLPSLFINKDSNIENYKTLFNNFGPLIYKILDLTEALKDFDYPNINILTFQCLDDLKLLMGNFEENIYDFNYLKSYEILRLSGALNNFKTDSGYDENKLEDYQNYLDKIKNASSKSDVINFGEEGIYKLNGSLINSNENISLLSYDIKNFTNSNNFKDTYKVQCLELSNEDIKNKFIESNKNSKKNISKNFDIKICDKNNQNFYDLGENNLGTFIFEFNKTNFYDFGLIRFRNVNVETISNGIENKNEFGEYFEVEDDKIILHVRHLGSFSFGYNQVGLPAGAIVGIVLGSVFTFFLLFILIGYIVWKKKGKAMKFMVPLYRKINKLFFKTEYNDVELEERNKK